MISHNWKGSQIYGMIPYDSTEDTNADEVSYKFKKHLIEKYPKLPPELFYYGNTTKIQKNHTGKLYNYIYTVILELDKDFYQHVRTKQPEQFL